MGTVKGASGGSKSRQRSACPFPLLTRALAGVIRAVVKQLHPSALRDIIRGVGAECGRLAASEWRVAHGVARRHDTNTCVQCLRAVAQQCGWNLHVAVESEDTLAVTITEARLTEPHESGLYLCELAAGVFAGVVAETLGYARVYLGQCPETPPLNCVFTIGLQESEEGAVMPDIGSPHIEKESGLLTGKIQQGTLRERLTPRELQVLRLIAQGLSDRKIAAALRLSIRTVENHAARIRQKLGIGTRTGLVGFAFRARLIEL